MKMNIRMLRKIQKNILAEPLRLVMDKWLDSHDHTAPCNTAACIAGHALALDATKKQNVDWKTAGERIERRLEPLENKTIVRRAAKLLGLTFEQAERLFYSNHWPEKFKKQYDPGYLLPEDDPTDDDSPRGRRRQARVAVRRIEHFIKTKGEE